MAAAVQPPVAAGDPGGDAEDAATEDAAPVASLALPDELLSDVFARLDVVDRARARRVCRRWRAAAVQPPPSSELALRVLLTDQAEASPAAGSTPRALLPAAAAAVLRGPLCGGLQRLTLELLLPLAHHAASPPCAAALQTIGDALPPTLVALSLLGDFSEGTVLAHLNLERTAPQLEELDFGPDHDRRLHAHAQLQLAITDLGLSHPSLRRLGATIEAAGGAWARDRLAPALSRLPSLEAVGAIDFSFASSVSEAPPRVRPDLLNLRYVEFGKAEAYMQAAAVLRGPLGGGLRRLSLELVGGSGQSGASALRAIRDALPPTLVALSLDWGRSLKPKSVLALLDLARTAPRLKELDFVSHRSPGVTAVTSEFPALDDLGSFSHPSITKLGIRCDLAQLDVARQRFPSLEAVGFIPMLDAPRVVPGIRAGRLALSGVELSAAHTQLLQPGAVLALSGCRLPAGEAWALPAGLAEFSLNSCALSPSQVRFLLRRTGTYAPGLKKLRFLDCLGAISPRAVLAVLGRVAGHTQIEIQWPTGDAWDAAVPPLARLLATSPALQKHVHIDSYRLQRRTSLPPVASQDLAAYRRARAAALWGMGRVGRSLMDVQEYTEVLTRLPF